MRSRLVNKLSIFTVLAGCLLLGACQQRDVVYTHYEHVSNDGWERMDTIHFSVPSIKETGNYHQQLMLRTNNELQHQRHRRTRHLPHAT